jgi:carbon-monoxide dehydrogenase medium subunit
VLTTTTVPEVRQVTSLRDAARELAELGEDGAPLAGGTWIMRAPLRDEPPRQVYVSLRDIAALYDVTSGESMAIGALVTHTEVAALGGGAALAGLRGAAYRSAFPQVRNVATVGGNIRTIGFPEADLVPPLLAANARVELVSPQGSATETLESYLATREQRPPGELIAKVHVPTPSCRRSGFERLTVRAGGEYAIANVAVSVDLADDGTVEGARVAVGSVEPTARLCQEAADLLVGRRLDATAAEEAGRAAAAQCLARDGLDAPGWYRLEVLPALLRRAVVQITDMES